MRRREFIALAGGAAVGWPLATLAQQSGMPVIGLLCGTRFDQGELAAVRKGLSETGYVEGSNVVIEYRSAEGDYNRLPSLANELVDRRVALILAIGGAVSAVAGPTGPFWVGAAVFLVGAIVVALRVRPPSRPRDQAAAASPGG